MALTPTAFYARDNGGYALWSGTAQLTSGTLTIQSTISGTVSAPMVLMNGNNTVVGLITSGSGASWVASGSNQASGTTLWAFGPWTAGSAGWSNVAPWVANNPYSVGAIVRQTAASCRFNGTVTATNSLAVNSVSSGNVTFGQQVFYPGSTFGVANNTAVSTGSGAAWTLTNGVNGGPLEMMSMFPAVNGRVFVCIAAGNSGGAEPNWVITKGAKTTDNAATWLEVTGQPRLNGDQTNTPVWAASQAVTQGYVITNTAQTHVFALTSAGGTTKSLPEPSWTLTAGVATTDNTATWMCLGPIGSFTAWLAPSPCVQTVANTSWSQTAVGGATNYVYTGSDHAEKHVGGSSASSFAGSLAGPVQIVTIDPATVPPTAATWSTGASVYGIGGNPGGISWSSGTNGPLMAYGLTLSCGIAANSTASLTLATFNRAVLDKVTFKSLTSASLGQAAFLTNSTNPTAGCEYLFNDCTWYFGNSGDTIRPTGRTRFQNCGTPIDPAGFVPTNFITAVYSILGEIDIANSDFNALGSGNSICTGNGYITIFGCKIGSGTIISGTPTAAGSRVTAINCDSAASNYQRYVAEVEGTSIADSAVVRTGGATVGVTPVSDKLTTTANVHWLAPFNALSDGIWNDVVGSAVTVTVYGIVNAASLPNNDDIWIEVDYPSSASSTLMSTATSTKTNSMSANAAVTADAVSAWDSKAAARVNGASYVVGNIIKVASNSGRLFYCTTSGTAGTGEPAGYASALDGGVVNESTASPTPGTAQFRAAVRFKLAVTFTPQLAGQLLIRPRAAKPSSTYNIDWLAVVS